MTTPHEHDSEIDFEAEDEMGALDSAKAKIRKLRDELEAARKERAEYLDGWQRCKADAINARKEATLETQRVKTRVSESVTEDLLPVLDSFDMAMGGEYWLAVDENWRAGMEHVRNQLLDVLARHAVERFGRVGEAYDPYLHEAVQEVDDVPGAPGTIARILRYGYKSKERIIRPAQVIIKK